MSIKDISSANIVLSPTSSVESRGLARTELALSMLPPPQQTTTQKPAEPVAVSQSVLNNVLQTEQTLDLQIFHVGFLKLEVTIFGGWSTQVHTHLLITAKQQIIKILEFHQKWRSDFVDVL